MRLSPRVALLPILLAVAVSTSFAQDSKPASKPAIKAEKAAMTVSVAAPSAEEAKPLAVGDSMPAKAPLKDANGDDVDLAQLAKGNTTLIVFYRGSWCPFCNTHLAELASIQPTLKEHGVQIVAISPDSPESIAKHMSATPMPYSMLSDSSHEVAESFGVAFTVDQPTIEKLSGYGIDLAKASGSKDPILPVPSVFVIDADGKITFAHSNPDYKVRLSAADVLKAVGVEEPAKE